MLQAIKKTISNIWAWFTEDVKWLQDPAKGGVTSTITFSGTLEPLSGKGLREFGFLRPDEFYKAEAETYKAKYENAERALEAMRIDREGWRDRWEDRGTVVDAVNQTNEKLKKEVHELGVKNAMLNSILDNASVNVKNSQETAKYILDTYPVKPSVRKLLERIENARY